MGTQVSTELLDEIFEKKASDLTDADIDLVCQAFRERRAVWVEETRNARSKGRQRNWRKAGTARKPKPTPMDDVELDLPDELA